MCSIGIGGGGGGKTSLRALLLALVTAVAALAALTLSAGAQTPGGEAGSGESGSTETAQGRIIARVQDQTGEDGIDNYRIEFGFFPEWALDEAEPWSTAITTRSDWLPSSRFLTKSRLDARAAADNRSWLRSSLITVPAQSNRAPGGGSAEITGRVIARYNPDSEGRLRVEFGFAPEWAFTDTSSTAEAVERLGAEGLPRARYLRVATIDARRDVWLRSSVINVPLRAPVVVIEQPQAPVIDSVSCTPSAPTVDESVTCTATLSGGDPASYAWSGGASNGGSATYITSFSTVGEAAVSLTVTNTAGSDTDSIALTVAAESPPAEDLEPPVIDAVNCSPSSPTVDDPVTCTATLSGGEPVSWSWSGGASSGSSAAYDTSFNSAGSKTVSLTVTNSAGSDTNSFALTVVATLQPPVVDSITCTPSDPPVDDPVKCTAALSGGTPSSYAWSGGRAASTATTYNTDFGNAGAATVSLTVTNAAGSDSGSTTVTANGYPQCSWGGTRQFTVGESWSGAADAFGTGIVTCTDRDPLTYTLSSSNSAIVGVSESDGAWTVEGVAAGTAYVHITVTDPGDLSSTVDLLVTIVASTGDSEETTDDGEETTDEELQAPVIDSISCSPASPTVDESVTCTATLSGGSPASHAWSGGADAGSSGTYSTSFSSAGSKTVSLTVTNSAGSDTESTTLTVAAAALQVPVVDSISCSPASPTVDQSVTCAATLSGGAPASYAWSGGADAGSSAAYSTSFSSAGSKTVSLTVTNSAGSDTDSVTVTVAAAALQVPVIDSISCSPASPTVDQSVTCTATLSGGSPASYAWSGGADTGSRGDYNTSFNSAGSKTVSLTVTNAGGSDTDSISFTVFDAVQAPVIDSVICSPSSPTVDQSVTCRANLSGGSPASYAWSGGPSSGSTTTYDTSFSSAGSKTVSLTVTNSAGSDTDSVTLTVAAATASAPVIDSISCSPSSPKVAESVACTATLSGGAPVSYSWSGGASSGSSATYNTYFSSAGSKAVSLTVTNDAGSDTDSVAVILAVQAPVINSINCSPLAPGVDQSVTCTAELGGGEPASRVWSGGASSGLSATYSTFSTSFSSAGSKTVSLTVTNAAGSDTDSVTLTVAAATGSAPVVDSISCTSSPKTNQRVSCTASLSGGTPTSYQWASNPNFSSSYGSIDSPSFAFIFYDTGSYTVSLTVWNVAGSHTQSVPLTVTGSNRPSCVGWAVAEITVGESATFSYSCSDPDGDTLTITASSNNTSVATVALSSSTYTITGVGAGEAEVSLHASDGYWTGQLATLGIASVTVR